MSSRGFMGVLYAELILIQEQWILPGNQETYLWASLPFSSFLLTLQTWECYAEIFSDSSQPESECQFPKMSNDSFSLINPSVNLLKPDASISIFFCVLQYKDYCQTNSKYTNINSNTTIIIQIKM